MIALENPVEGYDQKYKTPNYHLYSPRLHDPVIASLVSFCKLPAGATVLDVGCGQGFFSALFAKRGFRVHGIDQSRIGIQMAEKQYSDLPIRFIADDIWLAGFPELFDCVFVRSCSLHNTSDFPTDREFTDKLLAFLKPHGVLIFVYNSRLFPSPSAGAWRHHSMADVRQHFSVYPGANIFFVNRRTHYFSRRLSFTRFGTQWTALITKILRKGGDFICIIEKPASPLSSATTAPPH
jgi:SAM-dependent methyltransferase